MDSLWETGAYPVRIQMFAPRAEPALACEWHSNPLRCHCQARPPPQRSRPDPGGATDKVGERPFSFQLLVIGPLAYLSGGSRHRRTVRSNARRQCSISIGFACVVFRVVVKDPVSR